jgi:hypothetical protein
LQDAAASDSMEAALALVHVNGIRRTAVRLIKGMKLSLDEQHFAFGVFSVISWFKISERYSLGETCTQRRRDLRRGAAHVDTKISSLSSCICLACFCTFCVLLRPALLWLARHRMYNTRSVLPFSNVQCAPTTTVATHQLVRCILLRPFCVIAGRSSKAARVTPWGSVASRVMLL